LGGDGDWENKVNRGKQQRGAYGHRSGVDIVQLYKVAKRVTIIWTKKINIKKISKEKIERLQEN
jgi:hypothetical protein